MRFTAHFQPTPKAAETGERGYKCIIDANDYQEASILAARKRRKTHWMVKLTCDLFEGVD